uniref:Uncharacterized protein n=1 Tax=Molossus molossus TaxID=27622 RepID=A0A7J8ESD9_MOLMO|nr:hypothetical protein HJG59_008699 [Molossus molossus]
MLNQSHTCGQLNIYHIKHILLHSHIHTSNYKVSHISLIGTWTHRKYSVTHRTTCWLTTVGLRGPETTFPLMSGGRIHPIVHTKPCYSLQPETLPDHRHPGLKGSWQHSIPISRQEAFCKHNRSFGSCLHI